MKKLFALVLVAVMATSASAATQVWFASGADGAAGSVLNLTWDPIATPAGGTWTIDCWYNAERSFNSYMFDIKTTEVVPLTASNYAFDVAGWTHEGVPTLGAAPDLVVGGYDYGFNVPFKPANTNTKLFHFDLTVANTPGTYVVDFIGMPLMVDGEFAEPFDVQFAAGASIYADGSADLETPVISVTVLPEPATLALLAIGALALIRRR